MLTNKNAKINLATIEQNALTLIKTFTALMQELALENKDFTDKKKVLNEKYEVALKENNVDKIKESDKAIKAETVRHQDETKRINTSLKSVYNLIPETMYKAYCTHLASPSSNDFTVAVRNFLQSINIDTPDKGTNFVVTKLVRSMGAKTTSCPTILEHKKYTQAMSVRQFNKLFIASFTDMLVEKKVIK